MRDAALGWLLFLEVKVVYLWVVTTGEQGHLAKIQLVVSGGRVGVGACKGWPSVQSIAQVP